MVTDIGFGLDDFRGALNEQLKFVGHNGEIKECLPQECHMMSGDFFRPWESISNPMQESSIHCMMDDNPDTDPEPEPCISGGYSEKGITPEGDWDEEELPLPDPEDSHLGFDDKPIDPSKNSTRLFSDELDSGVTPEDAFETVVADISETALQSGISADEAEAISSEMHSVFNDSLDTGNTADEAFLNALQLFQDEEPSNVSQEVQNLVFEPSADELTCRNEYEQQFSTVFHSELDNGATPDAALLELTKSIHTHAMEDGVPEDEAEEAIQIITQTFQDSLQTGNTTDEAFASAMNVFHALTGSPLSTESPTT